MISLEHASYRMCERHDGMDHLRLQKSLYIAQMFHIGLHGQKLISTNFYAWRYGPVSVELYYQLQGYGKSPIPHKRVWSHVSLDDTDSNDLEFLDFISGMIRKSKLTTTGLTNYTHRKGGAWDTARKFRNANAAITEKQMEREFHDRYSKGKNDHEKIENGLTSEAQGKSTIHFERAK